MDLNFRKASNLLILGENRKGLVEDVLNDWLLREPSCLNKIRSVELRAFLGSNVQAGSVHQVKHVLWLQGYCYAIVLDRTVIIACFSEQPTPVFVVLGSG